MIRDITLHLPHGPLHGQFCAPETPRGLVLIVRAHHTPADAALAEQFANQGYATLTVELLSLQEAQFADATQNVPRLATRLLDFLDLARQDGDMQSLPLYLMASGDTTPAAIRAAAQRDTQIWALACHGGIVDRAGLQALQLLVAPLVMLFDADDELGPQAFTRASRHFCCPHEMHRLEQGGSDGHTILCEWFAHHGNDPRKDR